MSSLKKSAIFTTDIKYVLIFFIFAVIFNFLVGCAHHRDVRPGADGINRVVIQTDDTGEASRDAIEQANHYCKESNRQAVFIEEKKNYTGDMDEQSYNTAKRVSKVASSVGGSVWVMGGERESKAGGLLGMGGAAANQALGDGYTVEMKFRCQ